MSTEKTFHCAHFLSCAEPLRRNRHPTALLDFCLLLFRRYSGLVAGELLSTDVIVRHAGFTEYLAHAGNHSRRASYVENWNLKIWKPFREHRFGNVTKFPSPVVRYSVVMGDRRDELEVEIQFLDLSQFLQERSLLEPPDRIKKEDSMCASNFCCMPDHAPKGRDADATRKKDSWACDVSVKNQIAIRTLKEKWGTNWQCACNSLESGIAHAHCDHQVFFMRRAGD